MVLVRFGRGCVLVRLPFRMVLKCEIGTGGRKPQVEEYGLDELAASAESVMAGLGPLRPAQCPAPAYTPMPRRQQAAAATG